MIRKCFWSIMVLAVAAGFVFSHPSPGWTEDGKKVVRVIENDWPPYFFAGKPGAPDGFIKELLQQCIPNAGYGCRFDFFPVKRMYAYLEKGKLDLAIFSYKKERENFLLYGKEPIFTSGYRPVVRAGSDIQIQSISDFDSLRIGHLAGLRYSSEFLEYIEKRKKDGSVIVTTLGDSCLKMLLAGMIDVFVDTKDTTLYRAHLLNASDRIKILDFDIRTRDYYVTLSKKSEVVTDKAGFLDRIDSSLKEMKADGRYADSARKYGIK